MKFTETMFENVIQATVLIIIVAFKYTNSNTVVGLDELHAGGDLKVITVSAVLSVISLAVGTLQWIAMKKHGFIPLKGILILSGFMILSIVARILSIILYFAPALGVNFTNQMLFS